MRPIDLETSRAEDHHHQCLRAARRFCARKAKLPMLLSVLGYHAVMDGLHMGHYYAKVRALFDRPDFLREDRQRTA